MDTNLIGDKWRQSVSRRGFLKFSAAACAVAATPPMLAGCKTVHYPSNNCLDVSAVPVKRVFETASFGPIKVRNRLVRSATSMMSADEFGRPTPTLLDQYNELSQALKLSRIDRPG